jgi:cytochrome P450
MDTASEGGQEDSSDEPGKLHASPSQLPREPRTYDTDAEQVGSTAITKATVPLRFPLIGHTLQMSFPDPASNPHQAMLRLCQAHGADSIRIDFGVFRNPMLLLTQPTVVASMLEADNVSFIKGPGYTAIHSVTPFHLLVTEDKTWQAGREEVERAIAAAREPKRFGLLLHNAQVLATNMLQHDSANGTLPLRDHVREMAITVISELVLGGPLPEDIVHALQRVMSEWHYRVTDLIPGWKYGWRTRKVNSCLQLVRNYLREKVVRAREAGAADTERDMCQPLLHLWLHLDDERAVDMAFTLLAMGHENVSSAISWTLGLFSKPENWDLQEEVAREVAELPQILSPADLSGGSAPALERAILEALRLYPPIPMLSRQHKEGWQGYEILLAPYVLHRLAWLFPQPSAFLPQRWKDQAQIPALWDTAAQSGFIPFGHGPRRCPGRLFAVLEMKVVLACVLQTVKIQLARPNSLREALFVSLRPAEFNVHVEPRGDVRA